MDPRITRTNLSILAVRAIKNLYLKHYIDDEGWVDDAARLVDDVLVKIDGAAELSKAAEIIVEAACRAYLCRLGFYTRERE